MPRVTGSIVTVQRKSGPVLYIKARDRTGRQIKKRLGPEDEWSKRKRETALREFLVDLGRTPDGPEDEITGGDCARAWLIYVEHEKARAASTVSDYRNTVNGSIVPHFGKDKPLTAIERDDVDDFRLELLERVRGARHRRRWSCCTGCSSTRSGGGGSSTTRPRTPSV